MQTFYMTDAGKVRTHNEDNVIILNNNIPKIQTKKTQLKILQKSGRSKTSRVVGKTSKCVV